MCLVELPLGHAHRGCQTWRRSVRRTSITDDTLTSTSTSSSFHVYPSGEFPVTILLNGTYTPFQGLIQGGGGIGSHTPLDFACPIFCACVVSAVFVIGGSSWGTETPLSIKCRYVRMCFLPLASIS